MKSKGISPGYLQPKRSIIKLKRGAITLLVGFLVLLGGAVELRAGNLQSVIDVRPILESHGKVGNISGLAYVPDAKVFYLSHVPMAADYSQSLGFIYTIDLTGNLIGEVDLQKAYKPGSFPNSLSYDGTTGHLLIVAAVPKDGFFEVRLLEMDPKTGVISKDMAFDDRGGGITVRGNEIWQARFSEDVIRRYTRDGVYIEDISVAGSFPGFPGPVALSPSFTGGMYVVDFFNGRLVEIDRTGSEIAAISTEVVVADKVRAVDCDFQSKQVFLANNGYIYVLSLDPEPISINIKPHNRSNTINPKSGGLLSVALRTTDFFEAATIDLARIRFGKTGVEASPVRTSIKDADGDGKTDVILYFSLGDTGIACRTTTATLTGETSGGEKVIGSDLVSVQCDTSPGNQPK